MVYDVVVVGGGLAGLSVAHRLVGGGASTLLVDQHHPGRATDAGAGILSPETTRHGDEAWFGLVVACGDFYPGFVDGLAGDTGWARCGLLTLALADWDIEAWESAVRVILSRQARRGVSGPGQLRVIDTDNARTRFPPLGPVTRALWSPTAARVDGRRLAAAVLASARPALDLLDQPVEEVVVAGSRVTGVRVAGGTIGCGAVVIAGGAWSASFGRQLGVDLPVTPRRGQIVHLQLPGSDTGSWPIVQPVLGFYLVPWSDGRVAVGATVEPEAAFDARVTADGLHQLLREAARVAPGLRDAGFIEARVGLRPGSPDDQPVLGPVPGLAGAHLATGYGADGLLLSPYCGALVADGVLGRAPAMDVAAFAVDRFAAATGGP